MASLSPPKEHAERTGPQSERRAHDFWGSARPVAGRSPEILPRIVFPGAPKTPRRIALDQGIALLDNEHRVDMSDEPPQERIRGIG